MFWITASSLPSARLEGRRRQPGRIWMPGPGSEHFHSILVFGFHFQIHVFSMYGATNPLDGRKGFVR